MASSHSSTHSDAAKMEQIITEFYAKSLQIIMESRSPQMSSRNYSGDQAISSPSSSSSSSSSVRPRDKWFNLALRECPAALENVDLWRQSNLEPMFVDVVLVQRPLYWDSANLSPQKGLVRNMSLKDRHPSCTNSDQEEFGYEGKSEKIIERWVLQYESRKVKDNAGSGSRRSTSNTLHILYKKTILLLRSLYVTVRLLPAYKIYRDLNSSGQIRSFSLCHRVSSFVEPFTRREEAEMQRFVFNPVDTSSGRLCVSVLYHSSISDTSSESSTPMSPQVIPDYVGSPLAEPLKRFPSLPVTGLPSYGSPSSSPFSRRHSWSYDAHRASPPLASCSPSPTHSESHFPIPNPSSHRFLPSGLPRHPPETSPVHKTNTSCDEYCPSPTFSRSPSPSPFLSPPIHIPGSHLPKTPLRTESAPVAIPVAQIVNASALSNKHNVPPSPPLRGIRAGTYKSDKCMGLVQTRTANEKEMKQNSGLKISSNSLPHISSSSRSFPDDFDDSEFPCPFDVDDEDMIDQGSRPESFEQKAPLCEQLNAGGSLPVRKSQDAAVGELVLMLRKAPPLRQDFVTSVNLSQASGPESWSHSIQEQNQSSNASSAVVSSGITMPKTTADALEELQSYREMKNMLLQQGNNHTHS